MNGIEMKINKWGGVEQFKDHRHLKLLSYSYGVLSIHVAYPNRSLSYVIIFDCPVLYRVMDEGNLLKYQNSLNSINTELSSGFIFEVSESEEIEYCFSQKLEILEKEKYRHFQVVTDDDIIDVVTFDEEPKVVELQA
jgi:hypothetical protein